ncbi:MAG: hypothetical protein DDT31_01516 [Syntrophomonadaceae bacterium]|nr:hypothetical protein [Bacillota bacterium]
MSHITDGIKKVYDWIAENRRKTELSLGSDATLI